MQMTTYGRATALSGMALGCLLALGACGDGTGRAEEPEEPPAAAGSGTCDEAEQGGAGPWKPVLTEFRGHLQASGSAALAGHVKDAKLRDCPGGDREAHVLTDYDPHLEAPNVDAETRKKADQVAQAFTAWRGKDVHDEGWVRIINGAVETVTKRAW
ncbi:hypothetical protein [Streptomyces violascens]|uniref:Lipoprotein n=1 Tax=Streptomyces violascens TaxID=67381 RepID=A0ABQ3R2F7_9ACTN|nr:hypothetical protein [Streptomyces violascens]GGU31288.1 hypothetical protein GCM10010289_60900 [Streptomyces violascens]GHI38549.1 hypothetical protein Sviol_29570 [Streptomyces violascens]GHI43716.1 hypothetical protein Sviol_81240 [Streptomyces violascens]